jgi:hypothetical protein
MELETEVRRVGAWRLGQLLLTFNGGELPNRCPKCNGDSNGGKIHLKLYWREPSSLPLPVTLLVSLFTCTAVMLPVMLVLGHSNVTLDVPVCRRHGERYGLFRLIAAASTFLCIAFITVWALTGEDLLILLFVISLYATGISWVVGRNSMLKPYRIEGDWVWITGACPEYLDALPPAPPS